jgi:hypothetical protein
MGLKCFAFFCGFTEVPMFLVWFGERLPMFLVSFLKILPMNLIQLMRETAGNAW